MPCLKRIITFCLTFVFSLSLHLLAAQASTLKKIPVFVSILPQAFFVEKIGGDRVEVEVLVQPGQNPHTYAPTPRQMTRLAEARVYFRIGVVFENAFIPKIKNSLPHLLIVDTRQGIELEKMTGHEEDHRDHGEELDPHIWLDPLLVKKQAKIIKDTLVQLDPAGQSLYEKNFTAFSADLDALHARLTKALAPLRGKSFFVFHPAFGYFAKAYGLKQIAVETGGNSPSARHLAGLIESAQKNGVRVLFVQPQFSQKSAETVARAINGAVVALDPLARDYFTNMTSIAQALEKALGAVAK
ncbi:MAG: zinc ABC transporter substrate-binding protein [Proteobacteria bacterium]|nr:zinc ABC transporter substrate-binding protein [Pseudomonadota bacterium]MBU4297476.1 zinc ABC transporter substrate-binding protein [Pseudomonadota bacterium]MCG2749246.1 zinc ABC transporter substrate-binding protein [Desulfobulbaceae bacterium]